MERASRPREGHAARPDTADRVHLGLVRGRRWGRCTRPPATDRRGASSWQSIREVRPAAGMCTDNGPCSVSASSVPGWGWVGVVMVHCPVPSAQCPVPTVALLPEGLSHPPTRADPPAPCPPNQHPSLTACSAYAVARKNERGCLLLRRTDRPAGSRRLRPGSAQAAPHVHPLPPASARR
jgi:hypothetical protein